MTNEDQVAALFAKANPVPSLDLLDPVEPLDMHRLEDRSERSSAMTGVKTEEMNPEGPGRWPRLVLGVAIAVIAVVGLGILLNNESEVASPTTTESAPTTTTESTPSTTAASPTTLTDGPIAERTYTMTFAAEGEVCMDSSQDGCIEPVGADSIRITSSIPDGWSQTPIGGLWFASNAPPGGASLSFGLGAWLYSDPCHTTPPPDVPVGLTVDDFANALADHPLLEVTTPIDVTLAGYSGKYVDLQVPADISDCEDYWPWEPGIRAQGPSHRWHLWILDVDGVRVVVQSTDYEGTSAEVQAELQAMVDSIQIEP